MPKHAGRYACMLPFIPCLTLSLLSRCLGQSGIYPLPNPVGISLRTL